MRTYFRQFAVSFKNSNILFSFTRSWSRSRLRIKIPGAGAAPKQAGSETLVLSLVPSGRCWSYSLVPCGRGRSCSTFPSARGRSLSHAFLLIEAKDFKSLVPPDCGRKVTPFLIVEAGV